MLRPRPFLSSIPVRRYYAYRNTVAFLLIIAYLAFAIVIEVLPASKALILIVAVPTLFVAMQVFMAAYQFVYRHAVNSRRAVPSRERSSIRGQVFDLVERAYGLESSKLRPFDLPLPLGRLAFAKAMRAVA